MEKSLFIKIKSGIKSFTNTLLLDLSTVAALTFRSEVESNSIIKFVPSSTIKPTSLNIPAISNIFLIAIMLSQ